MAKDPHDRVQLRAPLGQFCSHRMPESMHGDGGLAGSTDQSRGLADLHQRGSEQMAIAHQLAALDKDETDELTCALIW